MSTIKGGKDRIAVRMNDFYKDTVTKGSLTLEIDPEYNKEKNIKTRANIIAGPISCSPGYQSFVDSIELYEFLYFDYKSLDENEYHLDDDGNKIYFVPLQLVFAATIESNKETIILPNNGIVLCTPFYGFDFEEIDFDGSKIWVSKSKTGIFTGINPSPDARVAYAKHIGNNFDDLPEQIINEDSLLFRESYTNYEYEIAGTKYWVVRWENIDLDLPMASFSYDVQDDVRNEYKYDIDATESTRIAMEANQEALEHKKIY